MLESLRTLLVGPWSERRLRIVLVLVALAGLGAFDLLDRTPTEARAVAGLAESGLFELGKQAGLRDDSGRRQDEPLPVTVAQEGGPVWITEVVERSIAADGGFVVAASQALLRVEVGSSSSSLLVQLHLHRRGWDLRLPEPLHVWIAPLLAHLAAVAGAAVALRTRTMFAGFVAAGLLVQLAIVFLPWPEVLVAPTLRHALTHGPLQTAVVRAIQGAPDWLGAVAAGLITLCVMLMWFDHRRSRDRGTDLGALRLGSRTVLGLVGGLLFVDGACRVAYPAWIGTTAGGLCAATVVVAWLLTHLRVRGRPGRV